MRFFRILISLLFWGLGLVLILAIETYSSPDSLLYILSRTIQRHYWTALIIVLAIAIMYPGRPVNLKRFPFEVPYKNYSGPSEFEIKKMEYKDFLEGKREDQERKERDERRRSGE